MPKLREEELIEEESKNLIDTSDKTKNNQEKMANFVTINLRIAQLIYDLMPVASAISDDPYLD